MAFFFPAALCPFVKNIAKKEESTKALEISYFFTSFFYFIIGIVGYFGDKKRRYKRANDHELLQDKKPFCFLSITHFFLLFSSNKKKILWVFSFIYNILYMTLGMICVFFNVNLCIIIGFSGMVLGFVLFYLIPFKML